MASVSGVDVLLAAARRGLCRVEPAEALAAIGDGAALVDIRSDLQRAQDGLLPGAIFIARNVLEWRCDPASPWRDPSVAQTQRRLILICNEGYQSSLAAATLQELGLAHATDVIGGFQGWRADGLPVQPAAPRGGAPVRPPPHGRTEALEYAPGSLSVTSMPSKVACALAGRPRERPQSFLQGRGARAAMLSG